MFGDGGGRGNGFVLAWPFAPNRPPDSNMTRPSARCGYELRGDGGFGNARCVQFGEEFRGPQELAGSQFPKRRWLLTSCRRAVRVR